MFRKTSSGEVLSYFRYTLPSGKRDTFPIGTFDESGRSGFSLSETRNKAGELSKLYQSGIQDLRTHLKAEREAIEASAEAKKSAMLAAQEEADLQSRFTLQSLCDHYCEFLSKQGKADSARQAKSVFKCHITEADRKIAKIAARDITAHQIAALVRSVAVTGKERSAGILRSYLSAAFNCARKAPFDPKLPAEFIDFKVESNPVEPIGTIAVNRGNRTLSNNELRDYISHLDNSQSDIALKLALYTGGQRIAQLLRAKISDYDESGKILRLWDGKGRRATAREHLLPLAPKGIEIVTHLIERAKRLEDLAATEEERSPEYSRKWLFSAHGKIKLTATSPGKRLSEIRKIMGCEIFDVRDIRRTCETMLAGLKISKEDRSQLLSHGLSGVQSAHYDRHSYIDEKRTALIAWEKHLEQISTSSQ